MPYRILSMLKLNFYLRGTEKAKANDLCSIYFQLEIEGNNRDTPISTKIRIPKLAWVNQRCCESYVWHEQINEKIDTLIFVYKDIYQHLKISGTKINYLNIRELFDLKTKSLKLKKAKTFFEVFDEMLLAKNIEIGTKRNYSIRRENLFILFKTNNEQNIPVDEIKYAHIEKLILHYRKIWSNDHLNKHAQAIKQTLDYAVKKEYISSNPIGKLSLPCSPVLPPKYLNSKQRQIIAELKMPIMNKLIDISIVLWNTGLSYTDYLSLKKEDIVEEKNSLWIKKKRGKSKIYSLVPILNDVAQIIEKYGGIENLPKPNISNFNKDLKFLGDFTKLNIETIGFNLSSSVFRETFCSILENEYMIDERTVMYMMGHRTRKQVNNYSNIMPSRMLHELNKSTAQIFTLK